MADFKTELEINDYREFAEKHSIDPLYLMAVAEVESAGSGILQDGRPKILFEGHIFWRRLKVHGIDPKKYVDHNTDILYPKWTRKHYKGGAREYDRIERAARIHEHAAYESASWGKFQVMGYHAKKLGYMDALDMAGYMHKSEIDHLEAFIRYCYRTNLIDELQRQDSAGFAYGYNGPGYARNRYDEKIDKAYKRLKRRYRNELLVSN